jgi:hypothetical protein
VTRAPSIRALVMVAMLGAAAAGQVSTLTQSTNGTVITPGNGGAPSPFQGVAVTWTAPFASNGIYAATNGHVFRM